MGPLDEQPARTGGWIRRKGFIGPWSLTALLILGCIPLLMVFARIIALPGGERLAIPGGELLRHLGQALNQSLSLDWIPPADRNAILYLLFLPTGMLLVAVARLTFGLRVLGLRAILIAIGFRESGILPSLILMAIVVSIIVCIRPWIRAIKLPMYARTAVIVSLSAMIMVGALLIAPWVRSEAIWSVAFFPVIIMAMLAEGVARTLEQDNAVAAAWRAGWTVILALVVWAVHGAMNGLLLGFPEAMLTQLVAVVMISEFLDLRLLEEWPDRIARLIDGKRPWFAERPKVAVIRNRARDATIGRLGRRAPSRYDRVSVQRVVNGLRREGYDVRVVDGDVSMLKELSRFIPPHVRRGTPGGVVLNLATGIQGAGRFTHVPAMLEMAGLPYSGPDPISHGLLSDRWTMLHVLTEAGLTVPAAELTSDPGLTPALDYPLSVRPRFEPDARRVVVRDGRALHSAIRRVTREYDGRAAVVEALPVGRIIRVSLLGNEDGVELLPLVERSASEEGVLCPAPIEDAAADRIRRQATTAFLATGCRDYARIDIVLSPFGDTTVVDIRWANLFLRQGTFLTAARVAGYDEGMLFRRIVAATHERYRSTHSAVEGRADRPSVVSIADRRARIR